MHAGVFTNSLLLNSDQVTSSTRHVLIGGMNRVRCLVYILLHHVMFQVVTRKVGRDLFINWLGGEIIYLIFSTEHQNWRYRLVMIHEFISKLHRFKSLCFMGDMGY